MNALRLAYLLQKTLDVYELDGCVWVQGTYARVLANGQPVYWTYQGARGFCLVGAIELVGDREGLTRDELATLKRVVELVVGVDGSFALELWNDDPARTYADVSTTLHAAVSAVAGRPDGVWV